MSVGDGPRTGDETAVLPSSVAAGGRPGASEDTTAVPPAEALRRELSALIDRALDDWQRNDVAGWRQDFVADAVVAEGYRRVVEDDTTVERLADLFTDWFEGRGAAEFWDAQDMARAAVRALRQGGAE